MSNPARGEPYGGLVSSNFHQSFRIASFFPILRWLKRARDRLLVPASRLIVCFQTSTTNSIIGIPAFLFKQPRLIRHSGSSPQKERLFIAATSSVLFIAIRRYTYSLMLRCSLLSIPSRISTKYPSKTALLGLSSNSSNLGKLIRLF